MFSRVFKKKKFNKKNKKKKLRYINMQKIGNFLKVVKKNA